MKPATPTPASKPDPALATVEAMIAELTQLRDAERERERKNAYQAAIDRLEGLAYRLRQPRPLTIGLPPRRSIMVEPEPEAAPPAPPAPPQRTLPLGPVVVTKRPRRR